MDKQQIDLEDRAAVAVAEAISTDPRPWWQRDESFDLDEITDEMIEESPGWQDLWGEDL